MELNGKTSTICLNVRLLFFLAAGDPIANGKLQAELPRPPKGERPTDTKGIALKKKLQAKQIEHKKYIDENGQDLPEIRNWKWSDSK